MQKFMSLAVCAALFAAPSFAQKSGSVNGNAPEVKQSIDAGDAKITLNYTSITWAAGKTLASAMDKEKGVKTREFINANAKKAPLATFSTSVDVNVGSLKLPAGEYKVGFTINDKLEWEINFMGKDTMTMVLPLTKNPMAHKRLLCSLFAGDDEGAGIYVAFGDNSCILEIKPAGKSDKK